MKVISTQPTITTWLESKQYVGIFILRLFLGLRLLYGVLDNIFLWEKMVEFSHFLETHGFPFPLLSAVVSVYVQFIGAISLLAGLKVRLFSFLLIINFLVALIFVHLAINDSVEGTTPALAMLFGCLTIFFTGAGEFSVDNYFRKPQ